MVGATNRPQELDEAARRRLVTPIIPRVWRAPRPFFSCKTITQGGSPTYVLHQVIPPHSTCTTILSPWGVPDVCPSPGCTALYIARSEKTITQGGRRSMPFIRSYRPVTCAKKTITQWGRRYMSFPRPYTPYIARADKLSLRGVADMCPSRGHAPRL